MSINLSQVRDLAANPIHCPETDKVFRDFVALLEKCFQRGDAEKIQRFLDNAAMIYKQDCESNLSTIEFQEFEEVITRMQKAAEIMEGQE